MTPARRAVLQVYSTRMGRSWSDVKREFAALSATKQGELIVEMNRVEALFKAKLDKQQARQVRLFVVFMPLRWLAARVGRAAGSVMRWVRR
jgi:hypothetical protein